jgi:hypothetical protein
MFNAHPIYHAGGRTPDLRYSVRKEYCGHETARYVARFCGDFIGQSISYTSAALLCVGHRNVRNGAAIVEEVR